MVASRAVLWVDMSVASMAAWRDLVKVVLMVVSTVEHMVA
jgi:hypothetical protein